MSCQKLLSTREVLSTCRRWGKHNMNLMSLITATSTFWLQSSVFIKPQSHMILFYLIASFLKMCVFHTSVIILLWGILGTDPHDLEHSSLPCFISLKKIFFSFRALFINVLEPAGVKSLKRQTYQPTSPQCLFKPTSLSFNKFITQKTPRFFFPEFTHHCEASAPRFRNPLIEPFLVINIHQDGNFVNSCVYAWWIS